MSMQNHMVASNIDRIFQTMVKPPVGGEGESASDQSAKDTTSATLAVMLIRDLSLPTAVVANIDQYYWDTHHDHVSRVVAKVNEVYPIYVQQVMATVKAFYKVRYNLAFCMTLPMVEQLMCNYQTEQDAELVGTKMFACSNQNATALIAEELTKIIKE